MERRSITLEVLKQLASHELLIQKLYETYAERFPSFAAFWGELAKDEGKHAHWIKELGKRALEGRIVVDTGRFKGEPLKLAIDYVIERIRQAQRAPELTLEGALRVAKDLENSLLEAHWFEEFDSDSVEVKRVLDELAEETRRHGQSVSDQLEALQAKHGA